MYYHKTDPDTEFRVAEAALKKLCKGIPGSHATSRLRKKRRKAVMAIMPVLESKGILKPTRYETTLSLPLK